MCSQLGLNKDNENFIDFLSSDIGLQIFRENMLSIHIETENIFHDNYDTNEPIYSFLLNQQDEKKQVTHATLTYKDSFSNYLKYFLDDVDNCKNFQDRFKRSCFVSIFCCLPVVFFAGKETLAKIFLTELYKNLTVDVLSSDNSENLQFDALRDLCAELGVRLGKSIFVNHERARPDMKR